MPAAGRSARRPYAGVAGVGKSTLLEAFAAAARPGGATIVRLDCRAVESTEDGFLRELVSAELPGGELHYGKLGDRVDAVLDDRQPAITGADWRDAIDLVMAIYRSAKAGQPVSLPLTRSAVTTPPFQPLAI